MIQATRGPDGRVPTIRYLELPRTRVTKGWVGARLRELREEIEATDAASY